MSKSPAKAAYDKWYKANRIAYNKARRDKYNSDKDARDKAVKKQRDYRVRTAGVPKMHFRKLNGKKVEVFRIGEVSKAVGRDEQTIRKWEKAGIIPPPSVEGTHRYYTLKQINLMTEVADLIDQLRSPKNHAALQIALEKKSKEVLAKWG